MVLKKNTLAFGRIPAFRKYELFMERYRSAVDDFIVPYLEKNSPQDRKVRILDVGSGEGNLKYFFKDTSNLEFTGIEISEDRKKMCRELGYEIVSFDIEKEKFPFPDNHFDVVVASHVIEHLYFPEVALKEIKRVTRDEGLVVIGVPMHSWWLSAILYLKENLFPSKPHQHHQFYTMRTLKRFVDKFKIIDIRGFRIISARKKFNWENNIYFYKFNTWFGRVFPRFSAEVNIVLQK